MADILSQEEVDLLLSAVTEGEEESEAIVPLEAADTRDLIAYDFRRPERVSKEQLKGLQGLFEAFAREVSIVLPPFLRTVVRVDLVSIDQLTYDEFILSVSRPTALSVVNMSPLDGNAVLETSLDMVFPIIDRVLGGSGAPLERHRELTEIEMRIVNRIILMMLDCLKRSWQQLIEFKMSVVNQESDPLIVQIVGGGEMVILVGYEVYVGERVGAMNWCFPLMVLNPVLDQIAAQTHYRRHMSRDLAARVRAQLHRLVLKSVVPVDAVLGRTRLPVSELARLQVGDVIKLDTDVKESFTMEVGGIPRFRATLGRRGEQSAVQVSNLVQD